MLEKPDLQDEKICACLREEFGIDAAHVTFLPLGADRNTAVYRVVAHDGTPYFLKLRGGTFDEMSVALPRFLSDHGVKQIIAPLLTQTGQLRAELDAFRAILYPFVEGRDGYEVALSERQWGEFGTALKKIHTLDVPRTVTDAIRREKTYAPRWRETGRVFLGRNGDRELDDPVAVKVTAFLSANHDAILALVERTEELARSLQAHSPDYVLCHSDVHAGNVLIDAAGAFYIVDWDDPMMAPKERDLMFIGGAQGFISRGAEEEERLFYRGYGPTEIDPTALAYYRYERIIEDIAVFCEQLLSTTDGGEDCERSLHYLMSNFLPGGTIERAYKSDTELENLSTGELP